MTATFDDVYLEVRSGDQLVCLRRAGHDIRVHTSSTDLDEPHGPIVTLTADDAEQLALTLLIMAREARASSA